MADELPDLSEFDKYLDDEDLEELERSRKGAGSAGKGGGGMNATAGGGGGRDGARRSGARRWLWLLFGAGLGVAGTLFLPDLLRPYLPSGLRPGEDKVAGLVVEKRMEGERLLLTVDTERGASLVTFTRRVPEIDLLVSRGDSVTLGLGAYQPLVEDPTLAGVRKGGGGEMREPAAAPAGGTGGRTEPARPADTGGAGPAGAGEAAPSRGATPEAGAPPETGSPADTSGPSGG